MLDKILAHPLTKSLSPDDPRTTELRRRIIREKPVLYKIYNDWYGRLLQTLPKEQECSGQVLELGAGGGFLKEKLPACICSEVFLCPGIDCVLDGQALPFKDSALRGIVMVDVLHHIPDPARFFAEAERVLHPGGVIAMLEPWNSAWSRIVYKNLHGEPFVPEATSWRLADLPGTRGQGPLSAANGALPWILFQRDYRQFERTFPYLQLAKLELDYPFIYLASGGVSLRGLSPGWSFRIWRSLEKLLSPAMRHLAKFALITIRRADSPVKKQ
jgi:SAM-dependent methyltransferase